MKNDLHMTFGQIFDHDVEALRAQLLDVQRFKVSREKAEAWVRHLRFLDISKVPSLLTPDPHTDEDFRQVIPVTPCTADDGTAPYITVSWRWAANYIIPIEVGERRFYIPHTFLYDIRRPDGTMHASRVPTQVMERTIRYAQSKGIDKIWIDRECIFQEDADEKKFPEDKLLGVQIMDVVYDESYASVGLLTTPINTPAEVDILALLLSRIIFVDRYDEVAPELKSWVDVMAIYRVLLKILKDPRWSRGWIFQEDHLSSHRMTLLIPYNGFWSKLENRCFGNVEGELQINLARLKQATTMLCIACPELSLDGVEPEVLRHLKQYKLWNNRTQPHDSDHRNSCPSDTRRKGSRKRSESHSDTLDRYDNFVFYPTTTRSVLDDICQRSLFNENDRIDILANALRSSARLDISEESELVLSEQYSLSTTLLALILLHGEIIRTDASIDNIMACTLQNYLERSEFLFHAPIPEYSQTFIDRCRFRAPIITTLGLETKGFLFRLFPSNKPESSDSRTNLLNLDLEDLGPLPRVLGRNSPRRHCLLQVERKYLHLVADKLDQRWPRCKLAEFIRLYLDIDRDTPFKDMAMATRYILQMMSAVFQALISSHEVRLAGLSHKGANAEPTAIIVKPPHGWSSSSDDEGESSDAVDIFVFTSWDQGEGTYDKETKVCLEVTIRDKDGLRNEYKRGSRLIQHSWVNGVFDFRHGKMRNYVFPILDITESPPPKAATKQSQPRQLRKRKRTSNWTSD